MEFLEDDRFQCYLEPRYIEYDEIKRREMLSGKPSAGTDHVHDGILNVAPAANCDVKEEEEEGGQRKRRRTSSDSECCGVCLDEFTTGEYAAEMPCSHVFHRQCIEAWLRLIHHCPICQFEMPLAYDDHDDTDLHSDDDDKGE